MVLPMTFDLEARRTKTVWYAIIVGIFVWTAGCADESNVRFTQDAEPSEAGPADAATVDAPLPDLRFKWIGAFGRYHGRAAFNVITGGQGGGLTTSAVGRDVFTALEIWMVDGPEQRASNASWAFAAFTPTEPIASVRTTAQAGPVQTFQSDFDGLAADNHVVMSLDITSGAYGLTATAPEGDSPSYRLSTFRGDRGALEAWVTAEAGAGRVVTALSALDGGIFACAYARGGGSQRYEARVVEADPKDVEAGARDLSDGGYFVTAFGRDARTLVLVGTRPIGVSEPRSLEVLRPSVSRAPGETTHAPVAWLHDEESLMLLQR